MHSSFDKIKHGLLPYASNGAMIYEHFNFN